MKFSGHVQNRTRKKFLDHCLDLVDPVIFKRKITQKVIDGFG